MKRALRLLRAGGLSSLLALAGCIDTFEPDISTTPPAYLVVSGFINSKGSTTITLSRAISLGQAATVPAEQRAKVYVEDEQNTRYPLVEGEPGTYSSAALTLLPGRNYRLHLYTAAGREYTSDYTPVKSTPPVDSVAWATTTEGVQLSVSTHDDRSQTRYYRWQYEETWEFTSAFRSYIEYKGGGKFAPRTQDIYQCWQSEKSTAIKLGNSVRLSQDIIADYPLLSVPASSPKLRRKYSLLVKQQALTQEEYDYLDLLRKNTENIGSLYDPLPSQLTGNIHCVNSPEEVVIGFIGAHSVEEKRIFIRYDELPTTWRPSSGYEGCGFEPDTLLPDRISLLDAKPPLYIPLEPQVNGRQDTVSFTYFTIDCVDCRLRGTNIRPPFWR